MKKLPSTEEINKSCSYDPLTGLFTKKDGTVITSTNKHGYIRVSVNGYQYYAHRLAWSMINSDPLDMQIDHNNHNRKDNRITNLSLATNRSNSKNRALLNRSKTGFTGVSWNESKKRFISTIGVNGKGVHLGVSNSLIDAVILRINANNKYGFHKNHGVL